jgi:glutamine synthetase
MLGAGLEGMDKGYEMPPPVELDVYLMGEEERSGYGVECLPDSLYAAIEVTSESGLVRKTFGETLFNKFIENKRIEWNSYRIQVTQYEIAKYLPVL